MKKRLSYILIACAAVLVSCSNVSEDERFTYVKPAQVNKPVLLEDFTGQKCVNCPNASDEIEELQKQYGAEHVIAVGIHSGPLGFKGNTQIIGLATDLGDTYYNYWKAEYQPVGMINRGALSKQTEWAGQVRTALEQTAPLSLTATTAYQETTRTANIQVTATSTGGTTTGKLQLWLVEDSITAMQVMPTGQPNLNYVHNHVLRSAVNGEWGDDITVTEAASLEKAYQVTLDAAWIPSHCAIVAFVYNADGVAYVVRQPVCGTSE